MQKQKRQNLVYTRQQGIIRPAILDRSEITFIGVGAVGSFAALALSKMGVKRATLYDEDGVSDHNLPHQFYRKEDIGQFKVDALEKILATFSDVRVLSRNRMYTGQQLKQTVVVATDSMRSRKLVWENFLKQRQVRNLIEARMGAELGIVYTIRKRNGRVRPCDIRFYQDRLYDDDKVKPLPCTARSIIYNVLTLAGMIGRAYKGIAIRENVPRELILNLTSLDERTFMFRL